MRHGGFHGLVSQRERRVEGYRRDGRRWQLDEYGSGETVEISSLGIALPLHEIYRDRLGPIIADAGERPGG